MTKICKIVITTRLNISRELFNSIFMSLVEPIRHVKLLLENQIRRKKKVSFGLKFPRWWQETP